MSSIRPTDPKITVTKPATRPSTPALRPKTQTQKVTAASSDDEATKVQLEGREKIARAQEDLSRTQREIEEIRDYSRRQYNEQASVESIQQEDALNSLRNQGYENFRELQRQQNAELEKLRKQGEKQLEATKEHFQNQILSTEKRGEQDLQKIQLKYFNETENEKKLNDVWLEEIRAQQTERYSRTRDDREQKLAEATVQAKQEYDRAKENSSLALTEAEQTFKDNLDQTRELQNSTIQAIRQQAIGQIKEIRQDTARKLAAYATRQTDPFYKLMDLGLKVKDSGESLVLTGTIPIHEQGGISISVKNQNQLVVSGFRRNEEKLDLGSGSTKSTSSYQSYSETVPLPAAVDARQLSKHFDGDQLVVTVPKLTHGFGKPLYKGPRPEKARVERPKFPDNIPEPKDNDTAAITDPKKGSRPLG